MRSSNDKEARALEALRQAGEVSPLSPHAVQRIEAGVHAKLAAGQGALAFLGGKTFAVSGLAAVAIASTVVAVGLGRQQPEVAAAAKPSERGGTVGITEVQSSSVPSPGESSAGAGAPNGDTLAAESALLSRALRELRTLNDPRSAAETIAEYRAQFPNGQLAPEAAVTGVEALLGVGDRTQALSLLDDLEAQGSLRGMKGLQLRVTRGELLIGAGRPVEALDAFEAVLAEEELPPELRRRARMGALKARRSVKVPR